MSSARLPHYAEVSVGDALPALTLPPITRATLAVYCGASGDHNPVHVDIDFARAAGLPDVITHGMLVMAYTGRVLTAWVPQSAIMRFSTRFLAVTRVGDAITASGRVVEKRVEAGRHLARVALAAHDQRGEQKTAGEALIVLA